MSTQDNKPSAQDELRAAFESAMQGVGYSMTLEAGNPEQYVFAPMRAAWAAWQFCAEGQPTQPCKQCGAKQAKIDALMLEHCPNEMTEEQTATWGASQRAAPVDLRREILAIPWDVENCPTKDWTLAYKYGHTHAIQAAAELVANAAPVQSAVPHTLGAFTGQFYYEHRRQPTPQECFDAGMRGGRDIQWPKPVAAVTMPDPSHEWPALDSLLTKAYKAGYDGGGLDFIECRRAMFATLTPVAPVLPDEWSGPWGLQIDSYMTGIEGAAAHVLGKEVRLEYTDGSSRWKLTLPAPTNQSKKVIAHQPEQKP